MKKFVMKHSFILSIHAEDESIILISGEKSELTRIKKELNKICETIVVNEKFPVSSEKFYTLLLNAALKKSSW